MEYAIRLKGLTKSFQKEKVLKNITHDFEKGKIHGIMGFNGSGKTVMFKCICGFLQPESGTVLVGGKQIGKELDFPDSVGIIIENPGFFLDLSGFANLIDTVVNALLYILSGLFIIKGEFTIGGAFAFITYSAYVVNPISALINIKYYFAQIEPSAKRLFELWGQPEELEMKLCEMKPEKIYQDRDMVFEVKNLVFGYEPGHPILNGISLCVKKGERIAIVGENGSGKSTLLNLLAGFYRPQKGIIKLYGAPVELMDIQDMRNRIAVISQRPYLFQGTIEENVNIDGKASRDAVVEACRKSGALGFIEKLDHGFGQKIGQDGAKLSGGERQKIAVARALLKNADILLMDEATEGFDVESNEALRELLHSELKNKTIVFITHKYKELESVDKVYRLSKGILELVRS